MVKDNGNREADVPQVREGCHDQGVSPGVGQPWVEVTFLERSRERLNFLHQTDEGFNHQLWDPIAVFLWPSYSTSLCLCSLICRLGTVRLGLL